MAVSIDVEILEMRLRAIKAAESLIVRRAVLPTQDDGQRVCAPNTLPGMAEAHKCDQSGSINTEVAIRWRR